MRVVYGGRVVAGWLGIMSRFDLNLYASNIGKPSEPLICKLIIAILTGMEAPIEKFQQLLREMFQFDRADLDFGIYRIMNHKRSAIEKFIQETLPSTITAALEDEYRQKDQASTILDEVARRIKNTLGPEAIDPGMELDAALPRHEDRPRVSGSQGTGCQHG